MKDLQKKYDKLLKSYDELEGKYDRLVVTYKKQIDKEFELDQKLDDARNTKTFPMIIAGGLSFFACAFVMNNVTPETTFNEWLKVWALTSWTSIFGYLSIRWLCWGYKDGKAKKNDD